MMTIEEAIAISRGASGVLYSLAEMREADQIVLVYAEEMHRMVMSIRAASFPVPKLVRITTAPSDPFDTGEEIFVTEETARRLHSALSEALGVSV